MYRTSGCMYLAWFSMLSLYSFRILMLLWTSKLKWLYDSGCSTAENLHKCYFKQRNYSGSIIGFLLMMSSLLNSLLQEVFLQQELIIIYFYNMARRWPKIFSRTCWSRSSILDFIIFWYFLCLSCFIY